MVAIRPTSRFSPYRSQATDLYPPDKDDTEAEDFAQKLAAIVEAEFFDPATKAWSGIQLLFCDAVCENNFTLSLFLSTKTWRVDHKSYLAEESVALMPDPHR